MKRRKNVFQTIFKVFLCLTLIGTGLFSLSLSDGRTRGDSRLIYMTPPLSPSDTGHLARGNGIAMVVIGATALERSLVNPTDALMELPVVAGTPPDLADDPNRNVTTASDPFLCPFPVDFESLRLINSDTVAWITVPDAGTGYPVVCSEDNVYYFLHRIDGIPDPNGTPFLDAVNGAPFDSRVSVIRGRGDTVGTPFADLCLYRDQAYYDAHPFMYLMTEKGLYRIDFFAGLHADRAEARAFFLYDAESVRNASALTDYTGSLKAVSAFESDITVSESDRIVILSVHGAGGQGTLFQLAGRFTAEE